MIRGRRLSLVEWRREREGELPEPGDCDNVYLERWEYDDAGEYVISDYFAAGDYVGGTVQRSNRRVFLAEHAEFCGREFWPTYGGHGYQGIVFRRDADERVPEIAQVFDHLEGGDGYLDEDDLSQLEMDQEGEDWNNYGRDDFRRWLSTDGQDQLPEMVRTLMRYQYSHGRSTNLWNVLRELPVEVVVEIAEHVTGVEEEELVGFDPDSNAFTDWASAEEDKVIDRLWWDLVAVGGGSGEIEHGSEGTHFNPKRLFRYGRPDPDEELKERAWNALRQILLRSEHEQTKARRPEVEFDAIVWPSASTMSVLIDLLLEHDGEWSPAATQLLQARE